MGDGNIYLNRSVGCLAFVKTLLCFLPYVIKTKKEDKAKILADLWMKMLRTSLNTENSDGLS